MRQRRHAIDIRGLGSVIPILAADEGVVLAYLFGSYACGTANTLSDLDIALLLGAQVPRDAYFDYRARYVATISAALRDDRIDVVLLNSAPPLLAHEAIKGRVLFERSPEARVHFEVGVQRKYLDLKHLYAIDHAYMRRRLAEGTYGQS